jgi:hypothetical protein
MALQGYDWWKGATPPECETEAEVETEDDARAAEEEQVDALTTLDVTAHGYRLRLCLAEATRHQADSVETGSNDYWLWPALLSWVDEDGLTHYVAVAVNVQDECFERGEPLDVNADAAERDLVTALFEAASTCKPRLLEAKDAARSARAVGEYWSAIDRAGEMFQAHARDTVVSTERSAAE